MKPPKVVSTFYIDPVPLARQIETVAGHFIQPCERGVYVLGQTEPLLVPGKEYFQRNNDMSGRPVMTPIHGGTPITGDVYNASGDIVLLRRRLSLLRDSSSLPVQGLKIINAVLEWAIDDNSNWVDKSSMVPYDDMLSEFIITENAFYNTTRVPGMPMIDYNHFHHLALASLSSMLQHVEKLVTDFIGHGEDDGWVMHFIEQVNTTDVALIKSIDYRIHDWMRRMKGK